MKTLKKLTLNAHIMSHSEMKDIRGAVMARGSCMARCKSGVVTISNCPGVCTAINSTESKPGFVTCDTGGTVPFEEHKCPSYESNYDY